MTAVLAFTLAGAVTYLLRSSVIIAGAAFSSPKIGPWIALVSPAVLTALVASALLLDTGKMMTPELGEALAVGAAVLAVRRTGNVSVALAVGLPVYWLAAI